MLAQAEPLGWEYRWAQVVGRAWADADFRQRLLRDPRPILKEYSLEAPADQLIEVIESEDAPQTEGVLHLVLPARPAEELLEEELIGTGGQPVNRCGCEVCHRCERCFCGRCGCERC